ncbi:MAG: selenoneine biosynthesis selenosugar synthase SenB [Acidobacteriota bacterium]
MKICLVTPPSPVLNGNRITAHRLEQIFLDLGHQAILDEAYRGETCDLLVALHARKSAESIARFSELHPDLPLVVVLTGTDIYGDLKASPEAGRSLELATRLVVLQKKGLEMLDQKLHAKTRVIYQSVEPLEAEPLVQKAFPDGCFQVCVIGNLRPEKDPLRTALAARGLPASSTIKVLHVGCALNQDLERQALNEETVNPRYRWLRGQPYRDTRLLLAESHLLSITSLMEGGSNVLSEALASSVPVVASRIAGLIGTLGHDYPGFFPAEATAALAQLLHRAETDPAFYEELKGRCAALKPLVSIEAERSQWRVLLQEPELTADH